MKRNEMTQPQIQIKNFNFDLSKLPSLAKHDYAESLIDKKINMTYREAIDFFIKSLSNEEKLSTAFENYREFKDKIISKIPANINLFVCACVDKFTGILYLFINKSRYSLSFYELDSKTQKLTHKGNASRINYGTLTRNTIKNDFHELQLVSDEFDSSIQEHWRNATFYKLQMDISLDEAFLRYPEWINEMVKNDDKTISVLESFRRIDTFTDRCQIWYFPHNHALSGISSYFNAAHVILDPKDIEMVIDLKRNHIKSSLKLA